MVTQPSTTSQTPTSARMAARSLPAVVALLLVFSAALLFKGTAHAAPLSILPPPPATWNGNPPWKAISYYVSSTDTTTNGAAYNHGCAQASLDASHGTNSMVVLDFGGQTSDGSGTIDFSNAFVSNGTVELVAEAFARGYNHCGNTSSQLFLSIGTNNSVAVSSSLGNTWAHVAGVVNSYDNGTQVDAIGGDDMEPGFGSASAARAWASGYSNESTSALYDDYGSADGCPPAGSCNNGWTQADEYYVAWGARAAIATPEIYTNTLAWQWEDISLYGVNSGQGAIYYYGSMATTGSGLLTAAQAYTDFENALDSHSSTSETMPYSLDIEWTW